MANKNSHPFLDPLWRRVVMIGACAMWFVFELLNKDPMWQMLVGTVTVYGAYTYLYAYTPSSDGK